MSDSILLETERMYLRQFRAEDAPLLFELDAGRLQTVDDIN